MSIKTDLELLALYHHQHDETVIKQLYDKYLPFLLKHIKLYYLPYLDKDDRLQECYIVLYTAISTYDSSKNVSFFSYYKVLLERHFYKIIRKQMAEKRKSEQFDYMLDDYELDLFQGMGYAQSLNPEDVVIVKETFEESCQLLSKSERQAVIGKYIYNVPLKNSHVYRGSYKIKKFIKNK